MSPQNRLATGPRATSASWTLPPELSVVPRARRLVRTLLADWQVDDTGDVLVVVSELVANAVRHAGTGVDLAVERVGEDVLVSVADRYAERTLPVAPTLPPPQAEGNRGLFIVAELAARWGVEYAGDGKRVWALVGHGATAGDDHALPPVVSVERAGRTTLSARGLDELCEALTLQALEDLDADASYCYLAGDDDATIELRCSVGDADPARTLPRVPTREGLLSRLADRSLPVVAGDVTAGNLPVATPDNRHRSLAAAPLVAGDRLIGALFCTAVEVDRFTTTHGAALQRIADERAAAIDAARVADLDRRRRGRLAFVAQASEMLTTTLDPTMAVSMLSQLLVPQLADWCVVHEITERAEPRLTHVWHADETKLDELRAAFESDYPSPTTGPAAVVLTGVGARANVVRVGLVARGRTLAVVTAGRASGPYAVDEVRLVEDLTRRAALALDNAQLHATTTSVAEALQQSLLPPELPTLPGCDVAAVYRPTGDGAIVGGDFYDIFGIGDGSFGLAVGDVCGKGAQAAAVTGLARHALRLLSRAGHDPADVLARLNAAIIDEGERSRFVTLLYAVVLPDADGVHLRLCSAGHPLPLLVTAEGEVRPVGTPQQLLGVMDDFDVALDDVTLRRGDMLVCFTDGVTERRDGARMLGESGLTKLLRECAGMSAAAVVRRIATTVESFGTTPAADDVAVVALRAV